MRKVYIEDFCEYLNYRNVTLFVDSEVNLDELLSRLDKDLVNHLYRFDCVRHNRLFYIENCDLQEVTMNQDWDELLELVANGHSVLHLKKDDRGFYIDVPDLFDLRNE